MYQNYKNITLPWLSYIPEHWELVRNKVFLKESKNTVGAEHGKYELLSLTKNGVIIRDISSGKGKFPSDFGTYKTVSDGQIIFCLFDIDETPRTVGLSRYYGMITGAYDVFSIIGVNPRFLEYYYISLDNIKAMRPLYTGLRKTIGVNSFLQTHFPLPPRSEQDQIVRYLDWKVAQINKLISAKRKQIALLQEQRRVIVSNVVTKKGDGYRNSSIKREFINLDYMRKPVEASKRSQRGDILYDYYGASGIVDTIDEYIFDETTLLIAEDGANLVLRNLPLIYIATGKYWVNNHAHILRPNENNDLKYMSYLLESIDYTIYITGAAQPKLSQDNIGRVPLVVPPLSEQKQLAEFLDNACKDIDKVVYKLNEEIVLFHEYRTRLISDVVTGKLDVRGVTVPEYEAVEDITSDTDMDEGGISEDG